MESLCDRIPTMLNGENFSILGYSLHDGFPSDENINYRVALLPPMA